MSETMIFGSAFAVNRYKVYKGQVSWNPHSTYKAMQIERAFTTMPDGSIKPRALYRAGYYNGSVFEGYIIGEGLAQCKDAIKVFLGEKEGKA